MLTTIKAGRGKRLFLMFKKRSERGTEIQEKENPWSKLALLLLFLFAAMAISGTLFAFFTNRLQ